MKNTLTDISREKKIFYMRRDYEPITFGGVLSSCVGIPFLTAIGISVIDHFAPIASHYYGGPSIRVADDPELFTLAFKLELQHCHKTGIVE